MKTPRTPEGRVSLVANGDTINGSYQLPPGEALDAFREDLKDLVQRPTVDAYLATCRAVNWRTAQIRALGGEPVTFPPDAPHYPPDDYVFAASDAALNRVKALEEENARLSALLNTPEVDDFGRGVVLEAAHQRERWGSEHDAGKSPFDWFWLIGYLAQKAATAQMSGDPKKALHHTISTAAALANWHLAIGGVDMSMRPGIEPPPSAALKDASDD